MCRYYHTQIYLREQCSTIANLEVLKECQGVTELDELERQVKEGLAHLEKERVGTEGIADETEIAYNADEH